MNCKTTYFLFLTVCLFIAVNLQAQPLAEAKPETVGISSKQLENIDALFQQYIDKNWLPGGTVLIARKGKVAYFKTFGNKDVDAKIPYQKDDIFRLASMTKSVTTVATFMLFEKGLFRLDDPVWWYLPEWKDAKVLDSFNEADSTYTTVEAKNPITIRHLLTHSSGISYDFISKVSGAIYAKNGATVMDLAGQGMTTASMSKRLSEQPLMHQPGEKFTYGHSTDVLGRLVEVLSGQTLGQFCSEYIFKPLSMKETHFYLPKNLSARLVPVYYEVQNKGLNKHDIRTYTYAYPMMEERDYFSGGAGLSSTTMDYAIFAQMLLNKGSYNGKHILGRKTVELMTATDQLQHLGIEDYGLMGKNGATFSLGFSMLTESSLSRTSGSVGTFGWGGIFNTKYWVDPVEDMVMVAMTQVYPSYHPEFWEKLYAIIYGALED
ncbi:MAG: serine hydrolase domain-containing protein [Chitinophagales bacterium]